MGVTQNKEKGLSAPWASIIAAVITSIAGPIILWVLGVSSNRDTQAHRTVPENICKGISVVASAFGPDSKTAPLTIRSGQFEYSFSGAQIASTAGSSQNARMQATVSVDIRNVGSVPVRVAFALPRPTLHADSGLMFSLGEETGLQMHNYPTDTSTCRNAVQNFTLLRPGDPPRNVNLSFTADMSGRQVRPAKSVRIAGQLLVQSADTNECWIESMPAANVPASVVS